ncbi:MAG: adenylate/guanylate cyclase domain-containing protein [Veillonella sp.]|uniref:adenylate/guanylate cyclase domain-containing protein n=1 Tax=Veillonella sp. TaxID=1926307 RepID=UPI00290C7ADE|nr:adenylate/guanylate cyclase domain-containing protein [Veillonella sp.]MDU7910922.1 adenylate/guanylate cyclase domain-containing protein [Veillonella parvula]MDU7928688.1 adenylate/guanylate cyclase domain-containing protein [Veillonella sp.]MDU8007462.1 adenylate/guanylate cyclase domain-containing protein [Veillonella sp.]
MEVKSHVVYNIEKSAGRIQEILDSNNSNYEDKGNVVPSRDSLTYNNGYYVNVTALFIDIVGSSKLIEECQRPTLAKIYRSFISECVAIISSTSQCREVSIHGDCVWGIFETPKKSDIDSVFSVAAMLNSLVKMLNLKLSKKNYQTISVGIGIDYGRTLMIQAGYKGSSINDIVWMGNVVNNACHLANKAGRNGRKSIIVTNVIYSNLNEHNQSLLSSYYDWEQYSSNYEGNVINTSMEEWINNN